MHNSAITAGMDPETQLAQDESAYGHNNWSSMNAYPQSTLASYGGADFTYIPPIATHDLPSDPLDRMHSPLQPQSLPHQKITHDQQQHTQELHHQHQSQQESQQPQLHPMSNHQNHHQQTAPTIAHPIPHHHHLPQLPLLMVPSNPTWPSMLTNPGSNYPPTPPSISTATRGGQSLANPQQRATKPGEREGKPTPRRMLTDEDRRRMCEYADMNPGVKQSDIGSLFGVERR